jgi:hypothetical protein
VTAGFGTLCRPIDYATRWDCDATSRPKSGRLESKLC